MKKPCPRCGRETVHIDDSPVPHMTDIRAQLWCDEPFKPKPVEATHPEEDRETMRFLGLLD